MASVLSPARSALPRLAKPVFRSELAAIHGLLAELEGRAPAGHAAGLADVTEFVEDLLVSLGWKPPPPPPFTERDREVLAAAGAL